MKAKDSDATSTADREIVTTRVFDAPRELVFKVWTDPAHIGQWFGPTGFKTTIHEMDVRPGGVWRFIMHGPDGVDYPNMCVYIEVVKPERLVYDHGEDDGGKLKNPFRVTVTFDAQGAKTKLTMRGVFDSPATLEKVKAFGAVEGGIQTLDRLAEHLAKM